MYLHNYKSLKYEFAVLSIEYKRSSDSRLYIMKAKVGKLCLDSATLIS